MTTDTCTKQLRATLLKKLLPWFENAQRTMPWREDRTPYRVWISELMLQQTRVDQVIPYFIRFMERFPSLQSLAEADQEEVLKQWEGLGYYSRARNLHKAAQYIQNDLNGQFPDTAATLIKLPGVGPYTAAAIASLAFNEDAAVLDGNVIRVLSRLYAYTQDTRTTAAKKELQHIADALLIKRQAGVFNEAMMELGATICTPRSPKCAECPIKKRCKATKTDAPTDFPVQAPRKKVPHIVVGAAVITNDANEVLVAQRRETDMLGGLWEFPGGKQEENETIEACILREIKEELDVTIQLEEYLLKVHHAYSHFTMDMYTYRAHIISGTLRPIHCQDFRWMPIETLRDLPYSKADLHVIDHLEKQHTR